jgi:Tol biopolymer transport system component
VAIPFDPVTLRAGTPIILDTQNNIRVPSGVSPDGTQIAYFAIGEHQEDLFIGSKDGRMRRITDDAARDRAPVFTPDGRSLMFYSNRDGKWATWSIGIDGGGLRKVANPSGGAVYAYVSPKGDAIVFVSDSGRDAYMASIDRTPATITQLPGTVIDGKFFSATDWSPDATKLAGVFNVESGRPAGIGVYDLRAKSVALISSDEAWAAKWLSDGRRMVYFVTNGRELMVLDTVTRQRTVVDVRLPAPSLAETFAISRDSRTIYYGATRAEADIWIVERK